MPACCGEGSQQVRSRSHDPDFVLGDLDALRWRAAIAVGGKAYALAGGLDECVDLGETVYSR